MKRWGIALAVAILSCLPIIFTRATSAALLADTDTAYLLKVIRARQAPFSWFTGDWPLGNHFYRPVSTLAFELDNRLYGDNAAGYGLTNALLCCLCVLLLAWFVRELTDDLGLTSLATALFGLWHWSGIPAISTLMIVGSVLVGFLGLFRHGFKIGYWLPAVGATWMLATEWSGLINLHYRMIDWIPGRTASVMTVFCLIALAAYARYERTGAVRMEAKPTSMDEPATKNTVAATAPSRLAWVWGLLAVVATGLALATYEQAVMLPSTLVCTAICLRLQRYRVRWSWQIAFWGLIVLYLLVRKATIPSEVSAYQAQQFRHGGGIWFSLAAYLFPQYSTVYGMLKSLDVGPAILMTTQFWGAAWAGLANVLTFWAWKKPWIFIVGGFALAFLAYLPMAWLNQFDHYHYWPMAMRSLYVAALSVGVWRLWVIAISLPTRQAPPRLSPAPGSLPRR